MNTKDILKNMDNQKVDRPTFSVFFVFVLFFPFIGSQWDPSTYTDHSSK